MSVAVGIVLGTGTILAIATFIHRLHYTIHGKMKRKTYRHAKWGISFLVAGMIPFGVLVNGSGQDKPLLSLSGNQYIALIGLSGIWMLIGLIYLIRYYATFYYDGARSHC